MRRRGAASIRGVGLIDRYAYKEMAQIWSEKNKVQKWLDVELAVIDAFVNFNIIEQSVCDNIRKNAKFNIDRIKEIEKTTKHDIIAFLTNLEENIGEDSRWIHFGMTSSDMIDTAFALQLKDSGKLILKEVDNFLEILKTMAYEHKYTIMIGRSHGIDAEPITMGLTFASWYAELNRDKTRLINAIKEISVGQISGAVGTFAHLSPEIEEFVCKNLGLNVDEISTQVVSRDRHAQYFGALSNIALTLDRIAINVRHLQRSDVLEVEEMFSKGQKGSSAMPHKRNPVTSENISGLARIVKSNYIASLDNIALWHERDISHSSVERIIAPDSSILTHYMLVRYQKTIKNLVIYKDNMLNNLNKFNGLIYSQTILLKLTKKGIERQKAYKIVQENAMKVYNNGGNFKEILLNDKNLLKYLTKEEIEESFSFDYHLKNVNYIFQRVFKE